MKSSGETKLFIILGLIVLLGGGALAFLNYTQGTPPTPPTPRVFEMTQEKFDALFKAARHSKGDANAPTAIIEFADIECPSCRRVYNNHLKTLLKTQPVRFAFFHYPLESHPMAMPAAAAAEAAAKQGKFWEMYAALFEGERVELNDDWLKAKAKAAGLNVEQFNKDRQDVRLREVVEGDRSAGVEHGVDMTPTFFIRDKDGGFHQAVGNDQLEATLKKLGLKP